MTDEPVREPDPLTTGEEAALQRLAAALRGVRAGRSRWTPRPDPLGPTPTDPEGDLS